MHFYCCAQSFVTFKRQYRSCNNSQTSLLLIFFYCNYFLRNITHENCALYAVLRQGVLMKFQVVVFLSAHLKN